MICTTVRKGDECVFMTAQGCSYNGGTCLPIIEKCEGCKRVKEYEAGRYCIACPDPGAKWKNGNCNLATHVVEEKTKSKTKINPIKASKRKS
jgi:hypothetical protein